MKSSDKCDLLYRVTKTRWREASDSYKRPGDGDFWYVDKREVDYRTRESDVEQAINGARKYSTVYERYYTVYVEVGFLPRFHEYGKVRGKTPMETAIGIIKARN